MDCDRSNTFGMYPSNGFGSFLQPTKASVGFSQPSHLYSSRGGMSRRSFCSFGM